ncbi:MAG: carbohydrate binding family 9 domain-containing protein [Candidatus Krumholzibacteriota bacterium]|nr:carbohydrate binding family 9 domain-containing protein [Candidatus Krumholzibacteriota bacterium]
MQRLTTTGLVALLLLLGTAGGAGALEGFEPDGNGARHPVRANGRQTEPPSVRARRIANGGIHLDGRLDESDWLSAEAAAGFTQYAPNRRGEPAEETVFKVLYDDDAIYFGVACYRHNGTPVSSCLARRDEIDDSDEVRIYLDPFHDLRTGYQFRVNPHGVKQDWYDYDDIYQDLSWDGVWDAATSVDGDGWYAEMRVPFSSIRYKPAAEMTWGLNVFQYYHSHAQRDVWSNWDREQGGFVSRSGTVTGLAGIRSPRQLEVTPYVVSSTTDPALPGATGPGEEDWGQFRNFGADLKYGVTANLTLNATIQPDFGQVEADPSQLNLSPYETWYDEKRPFFIEGAQSFYHPHYTVFYSRRIGTGSENSRIRFAGKLTGKAAGDINTALLVAATDETLEGQAHNPFKTGHNRTTYALGRFGRQFADGNRSVYLMQTAVVTDDDSFDRPVRDGYVTAGDFEANFRDRSWRVTGSVVGSIVDPGPFAVDDSTTVDPDPVYGTGARVGLEKRTGDWQGSFALRFHHDRLDLNDIGLSTDPDKLAAQVILTRRFNAESDESFVTEAGISGSVYKSWYYGRRTMMNPEAPGEVLWAYDRWHDRMAQLQTDGWIDFRSCWSTWWGLCLEGESFNREETRWVPPDYTERGPLTRMTPGVSGWMGFSTDHRRDLEYYLVGNLWTYEKGSRGWSASTGLAIRYGARFNGDIDLSYSDGHTHAQWVANVPNPGAGIGGTSYVFGEMDRRTWRLTLRGSYLFTRDQSLELYVEPYLSLADYWNPRELARPETYEFTHFPGYDVDGQDLRYGALNVNLVYRWEYRPASTFYLVWAHGRLDYLRRAWLEDPAAFEEGFSTDPIFENEPENRFMAKISYWLAL